MTGASYKKYERNFVLVCLMTGSQIIVQISHIKHSTNLFNEGKSLLLLKGERSQLSNVMQLKECFIFAGIHCVRNNCFKQKLEELCVAHLRPDPLILAFDSLRQCTL